MSLRVNQNNNMTRVILPGVTEIEQFDNYQDQEPQFIKNRSGNTSYLHIDTRELDPSIKLNDATITSSYLDNQPQMLLRKAKRLSIYAISVFNNIPNVNPRNNEIIIVDGFGGLHTATVAVGLYQTVLELYQAIVNALNASTAGITFTLASPVELDRTKIVINGDAEFYFSFQSSMIRFGKSLANLADKQILGFSKICGSAGLLYTKYIDFRSSILTENSKNVNNTNGKSGQTLIFRFYLANLRTSVTTINNESVIVPGMRVGWTNNLPVQNITWNVEKNRQFNSFDISLYDEFGEKLYIPSNPDHEVDVNGGFAYQIAFIAEL